MFGRRRTREAHGCAPHPCLRCRCAL